MDPDGTKAAQTGVAYASLGMTLSVRRVVFPGLLSALS